MECIIIDDDKLAREIIKTLCTEVNNLTIIDEFSDAIQAIKFLNENTIDLIFLDIHMPAFSGLDFAKSLKNPPKIILTTSDPKFALEAFEYDFIVDYLLKPIELDRFKKAISKAENKKNTTVNSVKKEKDISNDFYVNINRRLIKIDLVFYLFSAS